MHSFASGARARLFLASLSILISTLAFGCAAPTPQDASEIGPPPGLSESAETLPTERTDIIYFHRPYQCMCASYTESRIREIIKTYFASEMKGGSVTFRSLDITKPGNAEVVERCSAYSSQLYIITVSKTSENIADVTLETLPLLDDEEAVASVIRAKIGSVLE